MLTALDESAIIIITSSPQLQRWRGKKWDDCPAYRDAKQYDCRDSRLVPPC
jgi:hypothetical protein